MSKRMHLIGFYMHSPINHTSLSWADPEDDRLEGLASFEHWKKLARTLERGRFDAAFFADTPGGMERYKDSFDDYVRYGVTWPCHDPMAVVGVMLAETKHLGLAVTMSTSGGHPYSTVRRLSTLDYLSGGRVGWNIVSGHLRGEHRALGIAQLEHDLRYDHADEYMEICYALWNGVKPGAILADAKSGHFADPSKVSVIDVRRRAFPVPDGAAGSALGARAPRAVPGGLFRARPEIRAEAWRHRLRDPVPRTRDAAIRREAERGLAGRGAGRGAEGDLRHPMRARRHRGRGEAAPAEMSERIPLDAALSRMSGTMGIDFSKIDLDTPLAANTTDASRGMLMAWRT
jgi:alkanesulfonate monooxygenase SsuD/methylene tetrahydromethanopterin reductase-like flavin-dependent oxidoreductase (luciferase family)